MKRFCLILLVWALFSASENAFTTPVRSQLCPSWKDEALVYGVAPRYAHLEKGESFRAISNRLPQIADAGFNVLWLQPIQSSQDGGQGYDVTNYYEVASDLGTEEDLRELVKKAHEVGLRVVLDFIANHTSLEHPFARDVIANGKRSPFYNWYMHASDSAPYSWHYQIRRHGDVDFVFYFWDRLFNLNFDNDAVRDHLIGATEHWVKSFDVDGFRFDAAWGPLSRSPRFFPELKARLKTLKPELFLLAEDKAPPPEAYEGHDLPQASDLFDAVYDWSASRDYVSEWAWQTDSVEQTIFNSLSDEERLDFLRRAIEPTIRRPHGKARVLRFIENNDTPRFLWNHSPKDAKLAATLTFTLPGLPLVYYGQEVGTEEHYPTFDSIDVRGRTASGSDFHSHYRTLLRMRRERPELACGDFQELTVVPQSAATKIFAFQRFYLGHRTNVFINMGSKATKFRVNNDPRGAWIQLKGHETKIQ